MDIIKEILNFEEFRKKPPVLLDIGASGNLHPEWEKIAKYSVCIAFDADNRDFEYIENDKSKFKKMYIINKIVTESNGKDKFYLTKSPYCSSSLAPNSARLKDWSFSELFQVERIVELQTISLPTVLKKLSINYVDWFKTDSQGTDLRLFRSLGPEIISNVIVAEFEPGINDAYLGEDKMHSVMSFMEDHPFWLSDLDIKGTQRIKIDTFKKNFNKIERRLFSCLLRKSAFWGEMIYINTFEQKEILNKRDLLLGWIFCTINQQHGFAFELAQIGKSLFEDQVFEMLENDSIRSIKRNRWKLPFYVAKRIYSKVFRL